MLSLENLSEQPVVYCLPCALFNAEENKQIFTHILPLHQPLKDAGILNLSLKADNIREEIKKQNLDKKSRNSFSMKVDYKHAINLIHPLVDSMSKETIVYKILSRLTTTASSILSTDNLEQTFFVVKKTKQSDCSFDLSVLTILNNPEKKTLTGTRHAYHGIKIKMPSSCIVCL